MTFEISAQDVGKALGYMAGAVAGVVSFFHAIRRFMGQARFQLKAGDMIDMTTTISQEQQKVLREIHDHIASEREVFQRLLNYAEESAKNNAAIVQLLQAYIGRM